MDVSCGFVIDAPFALGFSPTRREEFETEIPTHRFTNCLWGPGLW